MVIKVVIFDQDGTLYPRSSLLFQEQSKRTREWIKNRLNLTDEQLQELYLKLQKNYPNPYLGFESLGLSINEYLEVVFNSINIGDFIKNFI
ncbi:hypothetical protein H6501_01415 [Candidatus Woesearchaeota archaeon]|nr:hypothetical protein [Candidatus Woesearchaeota archaeon]USN44759.1 MAG: hypothetical protein H6500_02865 [Candidatus Woesearchaeota archaeon]